MLNAIAAELSLQMVLLRVPVTRGVGSTETTRFTGVPGHVTGPIGVIAYVTLPIAVPVFVSTSVIVPVPTGVNPVTVPPVFVAVQV